MTEVSLGIVVALIGAAIAWMIINDINQKGKRILDHRGYYRNGYGRLVHRDVAYRYLYSYPEYPLRFGEYDIHHKDRNKLNNDPDNLQIVTREEHVRIHRGW